MVRWLSVFLASAGMLQAGCSRTASTAAGPDDRVGPHRGVLIALPGGQGYAEVLNSPRDQRRGEGRVPTQVVVYFLNNELSGPSAVKPTNVAIKLSIVTNDPVSVDLDPAPEASDPLSKNRFASKMGPYHLSEAHGELTGGLDGQPFTGQFDGGAR